ncbi:DUF6791 domain-containing protein [Streptomyces tauricus]|uniref:DUF6791 domain-containing protein n=1 Tax=Streptomyces tauricus TaxID=68274 RepID=UPI00387EF7AB
MRTALLARDPDLARLLDDGYDVAVHAGHIIVRHIPYVTENRTVEHGFLAYPVTISGDRLVSGTDHRIWFSGSAPCDEHGRPLALANPENRVIAEGMQANFMLSSKPSPDGYPDEYTKIATYSRIIADQAHALDSTATPTPGAAWQEIEDDSPFAYRDTATSRAGIAAVSRRFRGHRIVIVGLGGSGSYILDQVAKTEVDSILLIDGDTFDNHNAFRAPGAPTLDTLRGRPPKATYLASIYANMHRGVSACEQYLDEDNLDLLTGATFVFLASDDAASKRPSSTGSKPTGCRSSMSAWASKRSTAASADSCASPPASRAAETQPAAASLSGTRTRCLRTQHPDRGSQRAQRRPGRHPLETLHRYLRRRHRREPHHVLTDH